MDRVLSIKEQGRGMELVGAVADKLHGKIVGLVDDETRLGLSDCFADVVKKYAAKRDEELVTKLDNLKGVVTDLLSLSSSAELFANRGDADGMENKFVMTNSRALFFANFYDTAEILANVDFSYLQDIVYGVDVNTNSCYYKYNNELDSYFNTTYDVLELILNEDPENFYDIETREEVEKELACSERVDRGLREWSLFAAAGRVYHCYADDA